MKTANGFEKINALDKKSKILMLQNSTFRVKLM